MRSLKRIVFGALFVFGVLHFCNFFWTGFYMLEKLFSSECILSSDNPILQFLRKPPLDCSVCVNNSFVDTVMEITRTEFEKKYAYTGRPLVIRAAAKHWKAMKEFNYDFFKTLNKISQMRNCQFINYNDEFHYLEDVFKMDPARIDVSNKLAPWYIGWSVCDPLAVSILREYYEKPSFLPITSENYIVDWIFMGTKGFGAKLHIDDVRLSSWQAQIKGKKRWTLKTPTECLYICKERFSVEMSPGDIIVLDTNLWYHATEVISEEISITVGAEFD